MSKEISVKGIVLFEAEKGEADKIVTVLTAEHGRMSVICKGVKSLKSRRFAAVQTFTYSDITVSERGELYFFKEAEIINSFSGIRTSIENIALASYLAQVCAAVTVEEQDESDILSLLLNCLYMISEGKRELNVIKSVFEMRLCALLGFAPMLDFCSVCMKESEEYYLDVNGGVLRCSECVFEGGSAEESEGALLHLTSAVLSLMRYICEAHPKRIFAFTAENKDIDSLSEICESYFLAHAERGFSSLDFFKRLYLM